MHCQRNSSGAVLASPERDAKGKEVTAQVRPGAKVRTMLMRALVLGFGLALAAGMDARAEDTGIGPVTKLPMPRFVSLKADSVNLREGPNRDHPVKWIFKRAGLPVEITAEFEQWRRIRAF